MSEHPILFSGEMVKAILDGRKTQTRRPLKTQLLDILPMPKSNTWVTLETRDPNHGRVVRCRYGQPGDHLWVRETFAYKTPTEVIYKADFDVSDDFGSEIVDLATGKTIPLVWKPSIHMPRWASRIVPEVVNIRVQRVQQISRDDAFREGIVAINPYAIDPDLPPGWPAAFPDYQNPKNFFTADPIASFRSLWNRINAKRGYGWDANPLVWVIDFRKEE